MAIRFTHPLALLLLLGLVPIWLWSRRLSALRPSRRTIAIGLRVAGYVLCVLALAGIELRRTSDDLTVFFVLDQSHSVGQRPTAAILSYINKACEGMASDDKVGVVVFGGDASIESGPTSALEMDGIQSVVDRDQSSIAAGLRLALAAFPQHTQKRIVLISDGLETKDHAVDEAEIARGNEVAIDVLPLQATVGNDVLLEKLVLPDAIRLDEPFDVRIHARTLRDCRAKLRLLVNGQLVEGLRPEVSLTRGKNVFTLPLKLSTPGAKAFEAVIESPGDARPENNRVNAYAFIMGKPKVLLVDSDKPGAADLVKALRSEGAVVELCGPEAIPQRFQDFQNFSTLILSNVAADELTGGQMKIIQSCVRDFGMGLVMIGGPNSFGAGGYLNTPVEEALPVSMDVSNKKILPRGALVVILHTCEFPDGNAWARKIAVAALNVLARRDLFGLLAYTGGPRWCVPIQEARDKGYIASVIRSVSPGDMPDFDATMRMAYAGLVAADAGIKHMIIISDGDPSQPNPALADKIVAARITISTIIMAPHSPRDVQVMRDLASWGKGRFYNEPDPRQLPQIFVKEAVTVRKSLIFEKPFTPKVQHASDILEGLGAKLPQLRGYVCTTAKASAMVPIVSNSKDPVLAHWRYGLGKAVAFTSDAKNVWGAHWLAWSKYEKFWAQVLRWVNRNVQDSSFQINTDASGGKGWIAVDALSDDGKPLNFLKMKATVITPEFRRLEVPLEQVSPGRYEAKFDAAKVGTYMISVQHRGPDGRMGLQRAGLAVSYSPEFKSALSDEGLLRRLADITRGRVLKRTDPIFLHNLPSHAAPTPLWPLLLLCLVCIFPLDVCVRRVFIDPADVRQGVRAVLEKMRLLRPKPAGQAERETTMTRLMAAKDQATAKPAQPAQDGEGPDFLKRAMQAKAAATPERGESLPSEQEAKPEPKPEAPEEESYTQQLLKAKRRARKTLE